MASDNELRQLCEALGEPFETPGDGRFEPPYRMTWDRALDIVRGGTKVWSDLLGRAAEADADWLNDYRGGEAGG